MYAWNIYNALEYRNSTHLWMIQINQIMMTTQRDQLQQYIANESRILGKVKQLTEFIHKCLPIPVPSLPSVATASLTTTDATSTNNNNTKSAPTIDHEISTNPSYASKSLPNPQITIESALSTLNSVQKYIIQLQQLLEKEIPSTGPHSVNHLISITSALNSIVSSHPLPSPAENPDKLDAGIVTSIPALPQRTVPLSVTSKESDTSPATFVNGKWVSKTGEYDDTIDDLDEIDDDDFDIDHSIERKSLQQTRSSSPVSLNSISRGSKFSVSRDDVNVDDLEELDNFDDDDDESYSRSASRSVSRSSMNTISSLQFPQSFTPGNTPSAAAATPLASKVDYADNLDDIDDMDDEPIRPPKPVNPKRMSLSQKELNELKMSSALKDKLRNTNLLSSPASKTSLNVDKEISHTTNSNEINILKKEERTVSSPEQRNGTRNSSSSLTPRNLQSVPSTTETLRRLSLSVPRVLLTDDDIANTSLPWLTNLKNSPTDNSTGN